MIKKKQSKFIQSVFNIININERYAVKKGYIECLLNSGLVSAYFSPGHGFDVFPNPRYEYKLDSCYSINFVLLTKKIIKQNKRGNSETKFYYHKPEIIIYP